jgi:hypothetical protein
VLAIVVGVELFSSLVSGIEGNSNGASGPSSSYDSSASGTEALAQLLVERGYRVDRLTVPLGGAELPADSTVFVLDPTSWTTSDTGALERALARGDRVVLGGQFPGHGVLRALLGTTSAPARRSTPAGATHPVSDLPQVKGVSTVISPGGGTYDVPNGGTATSVPLLTGPGGVLAIVDEERGTLVVLASASPLQNASLGRADDAAFGSDLAGPRGSMVAFDEYDHGFGRPGNGLAGLPASWRWGLGIALLAVLVWMLSAARRFGPPQQPDRIMVPARSQYVDAMATLLSTCPPERLVDAVAPVRDEARRRLCLRLGVPLGAPVDELFVALARSSGTSTIDRELIEAVRSPPRTAADVVAVGTALAQLEREDVYR